MGGSGGACRLPCFAGFLFLNDALIIWRMQHSDTAWQVDHASHYVVYFILLILFYSFLLAVANKHVQYDASAGTLLCNGRACSVDESLLTRE